MTTKFLLSESDLPTHWYNVVADLPSPPPPPLGADGKPATLDALAAISPPGLIEQEVSGEREIEILRLLPTHLSNQAIADRSFVSLNTVKSHLKSIYRKLGAGSRAEAVATARRRGILA